MNFQWGSTLSSPKGDGLWPYGDKLDDWGAWRPKFRVIRNEFESGRIEWVLQQSYRYDRQTFDVWSQRADGTEEFVVAEYSRLEELARDYRIKESVVITPEKPA